MAAMAYTVELRLARAPSEDASRQAIDVSLYDRENAGESAHGRVFLNLDDIVPGTDLPVRRLREVFLRGDGGVPDDGLQLGRFLFRSLFGGDLANLWGKIWERRRLADRPLRLELVMDARDLTELADLPFELLADDEYFLFRRHGFVIVRAPKGFPAFTAVLEPDDGVLAAWAQPAGASAVPPAMFAAHEQAIEDGGRRAGLAVRAPLRSASLLDLETRLAAEGGAVLVSLVAHGADAGGAVWMHQHEHPEWPDDPGELVSGPELARVLRGGNVAVALLWSCHGALHHSVLGDVATALLNPEHGNLAAVVASPAMMRAADVARVAGRILGELRGAAEGDFERAVSQGRVALSSEDLQWAAPVYYARPRGGRTVTLADLADSLRVPPTSSQSAAVSLERAPAPWEHFRGRDEEIARGLSLLRAGRLVTVHGMAGMGKTDLASEIARRASSDEALSLERALWLPLDGVRTSDDLVGALGAWAGAKGDASVRDVASALGTARALVVLDNAEDPIRADGPAVRTDLDELLAACSGLRILLASRECLGDLHASREHVLRVQPLAPGPAREAFVSAAGERLIAAERSSPELERLLRWADGHPLTLMVLAKQVGDVSLRSLLQRIQTHGADAVVDPGLFGEEPAATADEEVRRERLVSSLDLSFEPLAASRPAAAEMFMWLGLFPAGLAGALVERVFGAEAEDDRAALVRRSLAEIVGPEQRLFLPAPVRAYARKKLDALPVERKRALFEASLDALGAWLGVQFRRLGTLGTREALHAAWQESPNVDAFIDALGESSLPDHGTPTATALANGLGAVLERHLKMAEWGGRAGAAERIARAGVALVVRLDAASNGMARTHLALGSLLFRTRRLKEAEEAFRTALPIYHAIDNRLGQANTRLALGSLLVGIDRLKEAEEAYRAALSDFHAIDDRLGQANTHVELGSLLVRTERPKEAEEAYRTALPIYRDIDQRVGQANTHLALGLLFVGTYRLKEAEPAYRAALRDFQAMGDRVGQANTHRALGALFVHTDRLKEAERAYRTALPIFHAVDERLGQANTQKALGDLLVRTDQLKEAEEAYRMALLTFDAIGSRMGQGHTHLALGELFVRTDRLKEAEEAYRTALPIYHAIDDRGGQANTQVVLGELFARTDRLEEAERAYRTALPIFNAIDDRIGQANTLASFGKLALSRGFAAVAFERMLQALSIYRAIGNAMGEAMIHAWLGHAARAAQEVPRAVGLAAYAFRMFESLEDHGSQVLILMDLAWAFETLQLEEANYAAGTLAWHHAAGIGHPLAARCAEQNGIAAPPPGAVAGARALLAAVIARFEADQRASGEDLYAPLAPPDSP